MTMKPDEDVKLLADDELLSAAKTLAGEERLLTAKLLRHLHEIEKRLLFAKLGYSSLFAYVTEELGYCGASAQARIASMRLMAAIPSVENKIVTGSVSLTNLAQAQRFFNQERREHKNHFSVAEKKQVIEKLVGKSTRDAEKELMALSSSPEQFCRPDQVRPVTPTLSEVRFLADQHLLDQLDQIRGLLAHQDANLSLAELIAKMAAITLEKLHAARFATLKKKRETSEEVKNVATEKSEQPPRKATKAEAQVHSRSCMPATARTTDEPSDFMKLRASVQGKQQALCANSPVTSGAKTEWKNQSPGAHCALSAKQALTTTKSQKSESESGSVSVSPPTPAPVPALTSVPSEVSDSAPAPTPTSAPASALQVPSPQPRPQTQSQRSQRSRHIPRAVKRAVLRRDGYRCSYVDPVTKRRCGSTFALELDHLVPWAKGGPSIFANLQTKCAVHNAWAATQAFGQQKMQSFRACKTG